jgi:hypothetical protein
MSKTITIPRLTPGAEPLKITIAKLTNATNRRATVLNMQYFLARRTRAVELLEREAEESKGMLQQIKVTPMLADSLDHASVVYLRQAGEAAAARKKLEADRLRVINCLGEVGDFDIDVLQAEDSPIFTAWLIAEKILLNPIYVEICTGLTLADFEDVDFDDLALVCREIMRVNATFFSAALPTLWTECQKHQDQPTA